MWLHAMLVCVHHCARPRHRQAPAGAASRTISPHALDHACRLNQPHTSDAVAGPAWSKPRATRCCGAWPSRMRHAAWSCTSQPIGMVTEVMERSLQSPGARPGPGRTTASSKINGLLEGRGRRRAWTWSPGWRRRWCSTVALDAGRATNAWPLLRSNFSLPRLPRCANEVKRHGRCRWPRAARAHAAAGPALLAPDGSHCGAWPTSCITATPGRARGARSRCAVQPDHGRIRCPAGDAAVPPAGSGARSRRMAGAEDVQVQRSDARRAADLPGPGLVAGPAGHERPAARKKGPAEAGPTSKGNLAM